MGRPANARDEYPRPERSLNIATVIADHAARLRKNPNAFVATLLRSRSRQATEILAHFASGGAALSAELISAARTARLRDFGPTLDPSALGRLATVLATQGPTPEIDDAIALYAAICAEYSEAALQQRDLQVYAQTLAISRERAALLDLLQRATLDQEVQLGISADLHNPFIYSDLETTTNEWLDLFSAAIESDLPVGIRDEGGDPFDRLSARPNTAVQQAEMITVVTSAYEPDDALIGAAQSMVSQSWQNWEMIIVDDASQSAKAREVLSRAEKIDPRIRVIRKAVNGGTYRARNTAIMQARGEFLTCLDSDDWAHPNRLLHGVEPMLRSPSVVATRTRGARVSRLLEVSRPGYKPLFTAASSLMFRIPVATTRIGFFESVRKAADTEYARRLEAAFGTRVVDIPGGAHTLLRSDDHSLSASEFSYGWRHPARWAYKQSYSARHRAIKSRASDPFVEPDYTPSSFGIRRWVKPADTQGLVDQSFDVVVAGDWRRYGGPQISMLEEISALLDADLRVGVLHIEAMRFFTHRDEPLCEPLRELLAAGKVSLIHLDDSVDVRLLLLRYPPILQFPPSGPTAIRARKVRIVANQAPAEKNGDDQRYVPIDVHRNAKEIFGGDVAWVPQSPSIRELLEPLLPETALATWDNPAIINVDEWWQSRDGARLDGVAIGRFSRDDVIKFPRTGRELLSAYDFPSPDRVTMMGAEKQVRRLLSEEGLSIPANWSLLAHKAVPVREFLSELDAVVYIDHPDAHEAFGRSILESAASGLLVIASPKHRATFGDALLYAEPHETVPLAYRYLRDPVLLEAQLAKTKKALRERWSSEAFLARVNIELRSLPAGRSIATGSAGETGPFWLRLERKHFGVDTLVRRSDRAPEVTRWDVRRFADGGRADQLYVIHRDDSGSIAAGAARDLMASHKPGWELSLPSDFPDGVYGFIWDDGVWHTSLIRGCVASPIGDTLMITREALPRRGSEEFTQMSRDQ